MFIGMVLSKYLPIMVVDGIVMFLTKLKFGNLSKYGIQNPKMGPFHIKQNEGHSPIIDVGTIKKIKSGDIQVQRYAHYIFLILCINFHQHQ